MHWIPRLLVSMFWAHTPLQAMDTAGVMHQPLELHGDKAVVLIFVGVDCPISNSYAPLINQMVAEDRGKGLDFYIVYSDPKLSVETAQKHVKDFGYACPGLMDHNQMLMRRVGATVTPEAAVVDGHGVMLYEGRIDNRYEDFGKQRYAATKHELMDALESIVQGKKIAVPVTKTVGCPI